ncbi:MAG: hypothetical protein K6F96_09300 [Bacteroidales bacterium]|nr:hypothetical protein [Bacteroidales bacterium]
MKKFFFILALSLLSFSGMAQKFSEDDVKQFYRTLQGVYVGQLNDSTTVTMHFASIWEYDPFKWLYLEVINDVTKEVMTQNVLEVIPVSDITFKLAVYQLKSPELFVGKWSNRNFFDGFNTAMLTGKGVFKFMKTKNYEYQTEWNSRKALTCFPSGDKLHFKFSQGDERLDVKRLLKGSSHLVGYFFLKAPMD